MGGVLIMYIKLKNDEAEFKAGDIVKAIYAHNLPRKNSAPAGYWLQQGKDKNGVKWKNHPVGKLIPFNDAQIIKQSAQEEKYEAKQHALEYLHNHLKPGATVYTKTTHISSSGMSRNIHVLIPVNCYDHGKITPAITNISWAVAKAAGYKLAKDGGLVVGGCGMNMGFSVVYCLASTMFGRDERCKQYKFKSGRNGSKEYETDGGYLLKQQWI